MMFGFRNKKLKPSWFIETANPNIIIWKLLISASGILLGEERDIEAKTASLFAIEVVSGKVLWRHITLDEAWWFGSEKANSDTLFIQTFRKPDLPEPKGIIALDIHTGETRWKEPELTFLFVQGSKVFAMRQGFSHRSYCALDAMTGELLEDFEEDDTAIAEARSQLTEIDPQSHFAEPLTEAAPEREQLFAGAKDIIDPRDVRGGIEFLQFRKYLLYCLHVRALGADALLRNMLTNELLILDRASGKLLFRETLHRETPFPLPDNFFVTHDTLIYVKEKRTLVGIALP